MKNKSFLLLATTVLSHNSYALDNDKKLHVGLSTVVGASTTVYTQNSHKGFIVCSTVGLTKEVYDEFDYGGFDMEDLAYDVVGCAIGSYIIGEGWNVSVNEDEYKLGYTLKF